MSRQGDTDFPPPGEEPWGYEKKLSNEALESRMGLIETMRQLQQRFGVGEGVLIDASAGQVEFPVGKVFRVTALAGAHVYVEGNGMAKSFSTWFMLHHLNQSSWKVVPKPKVEE